MTKEITEVEKEKDVIDVDEIQKREEKKYYDINWIKNEIQKIENTRDRTLITTMLYTGIRATEAVNIKKKDIKHKDNMLRISHLKRTKKEERIIPVKPKIITLLRTYTSALNKNDKIFDITRQRVWQITKKHINGNPHMLRHTFAINWLKNDGNIVMLKKYLGHKNLRTTMEYLKVVPVDIQKELEKIPI